jgi:hypothetical protein
MANNMYVNLSGQSISVYDEVNRSKNIGTIKNNDLYVINFDAFNNYSVYVKDTNSNSLILGIIKKPIEESGMQKITDYYYSKELINGEMFYIFRVRKDSNLFDRSANYIGYVKNGMYVACKDTLAGTSYPYLKYINYVMSSSRNQWILLDNGGFVDTGLKEGAEDDTIGMYGSWGNNNPELPLPEEKEIINGLYLNLGEELTTFDEDNNIVGSIPTDYVYTVVEKYSSRVKIKATLSDGIYSEAYIKNYSSAQMTSVLDKSFGIESIEGKEYHIFQARRLTPIHTSYGGSWGNVAANMLIATSVNQTGKTNGHFFRVDYIQRSSDLSWVKVEDDYGFIDTGVLTYSASPSKISMYGDWGGNFKRLEGTHAVPTLQSAIEQYTNFTCNGINVKIPYYMTPTGTDKYGGKATPAKIQQFLINHCNSTSEYQTCANNNKRYTGIDCSGLVAYVLNETTGGKILEKWNTTYGNGIGARELTNPSYGDVISRAKDIVPGCTMRSDNGGHVLVIYEVVKTNGIVTCVKYAHSNSSKGPHKGYIDIGDETKDLDDIKQTWHDASYTDATAKDYYDYTLLLDCIKGYIS